mgnify:CR=1 FL=1
MNNAYNNIKIHMEYPIGLFVGWLGKSLGLSKFLQITNFAHITERVIDGTIGIAFLIVSVIITHYVKKFLIAHDEKLKK